MYYSLDRFQSFFFSVLLYDKRKYFQPKIMFIYSIFWGEISQIWFTPSNCWGNGLKPTVYINDSLVYSGIPNLKIN